MESIQVREAEAADVPLLITLMTEFYAESGYPLPSGAATQAFEALLADRALGRVFLAERGGEAAGHGVLTVAFSMEYGGLRGFVDDLFVRPAHRKQGVASALLAAIRAAAPALGARALLVETSAENEAAVAAYRKAGYASGGRLLMELPLAAPIHERVDEMSAADLEALFQEVAAVSTSGEVRALVLRRGGGVHEMPSRVELDPVEGVRGDRWREDASPNPEAQVSIIDVRVAGILAGGDAARLGEPGDNIVVDLDVGEESLPVGARLSAGTAILEVTAKPHTGCLKFRERFGDAALRWVSVPALRPARRRGVYARVIEGGVLAVGDRVIRLPDERAISGATTADR